jgi:hypothetical protein
VYCHEDSCLSSDFGEAGVSPSVLLEENVDPSEVGGCHGEGGVLSK